MAKLWNSETFSGCFDLRTVKEKFKQICLKATANLDSLWDKILCALSQYLKALTEQELETSEKNRCHFSLLFSWEIATDVCKGHCSLQLAETSK